VWAALPGRNSMSPRLCEALPVSVTNDCFLKCLAVPELAPKAQTQLGRVRGYKAAESRADNPDQTGAVLCLRMS